MFFYHPVILQLTLIYWRIVYGPTHWYLKLFGLVFLGFLNVDYQKAYIENQNISA